MDRVYQQARGVLVWLGASQETDSLAFAAMTAYLTKARGDGTEDNWQPEDIWQRLGEGLRDRCYCPCCSERFELSENLATDALLAIKKLLRRSWFTRLWVVYVRTQGHHGLLGAC